MPSEECRHCCGCCRPSQCHLACAAVTAGLIESEIHNKNRCDFGRYYSSASAYHSIADAIQKRMDILAKVSLAGVHLSNVPDAHDKHLTGIHISLLIRWCGLFSIVRARCCPGIKHHSAGSAWSARKMPMHSVCGVQSTQHAAALCFGSTVSAQQAKRSLGVYSRDERLGCGFCRTGPSSCLHRLQLRLLQLPS